MIKIILVSVSILLASDSLLSLRLIDMPARRPYTHDFNLIYHGEDSITISWVSPLDWGLNGGLIFNPCSTITDSFKVFLKKANGDLILLIETTDVSLSTITVSRSEILSTNGDSIVGTSYNRSFECSTLPDDGPLLQFPAQQFQRIANPEEVLVEAVKTETGKTKHDLSHSVQTITSPNLLTIVTNIIPIQQIRLLSLSGQTVKLEKNISRTRVNISTSSISNGLYVIEIKTQNVTFYTKAIIAK